MSMPNEPSPEAHSAAGPSQAPPRPHDGRETVLLVDDDPAVRSLARTILTRSGYTVLDAASGEEAIALASQHTSQIHLLLTDINMPGLGGRALEELLVQARPRIRTLFISGDPSNALVHRGPVVEMAPFVPKPFKPDMLVRAVRAVLDSK